MIFVFFFADFSLKVRKLPLLALRKIKPVRVYQSRCYSNKRVFWGININFLEAFVEKNSRFWMDLTGEQEIRGND